MTQPQKRSFFERLTGSIRMEEDEPVQMSQTTRKAGLYRMPAYTEETYTVETEEEVDEVDPVEDYDEPQEAQLAVDVYETNDMVVVKTMTAGVKKDDLQISVTRETLTIKGIRETDTRGYQHHYHNKELYWGSFARTLDLPTEVDIEQAVATEHHGLVTIKLPKFDKQRQATIKIQ